MTLVKSRIGWRFVVYCQQIPITLLDPKMYKFLSQLWHWHAPLSRSAYLLAGVTLFLVKFAIDSAVAWYVFNRGWSFSNYLIWPNQNTVYLLDLAPDDQRFSLFMLALSLPFIWIGIVLTYQRLRSCGLPVLFILLFFVPVLNLLLFLALVILPSRWPNQEELEKVYENDPYYGKVHRLHRRLVGSSKFGSGVLACLLTVPPALVTIFAGANLLGSYGFGVFVGVPFAVGLLSTLLFGLSNRQSMGDCMLVATSAVFLLGLIILLIAIEGLICLVMAAPIFLVLTYIGALLGFCIQDSLWLSEESSSLTLSVLAFLPCLLVLEAGNEPEPLVRQVTTTVVIDAPPEKVWQHVVAFPPIPEPSDWFFQTGIAYPKHAEIRGHGVGSIRLCVFSTGAFVEPIEVWDEPRHLAFRVEEQPAPMTEWSPFDIHPHHLDHYLVSRKGEFRLITRGDGTTELQGTTWYSNRMWPALYWNQWSDYIIHRIHGRVLEHIRQVSETKE